MCWIIIIIIIIIDKVVDALQLLLCSDGLFCAESTEAYSPIFTRDLIRRTQALHQNNVDTSAHSDASARRGRPVPKAEVKVKVNTSHGHISHRNIRKYLYIYTLFLSYEL